MDNNIDNLSRIEDQELTDAQLEGTGKHAPDAKKEVAVKAVDKNAVHNQLNDELMKKKQAKQGADSGSNLGKPSLSVQMRAQAILESEKLGKAVYIPVNCDDEQLVWNHVIKAFKDMSQHDYSQDTKKFDAYSMQYFMNTYFLARTRLCRVQQDEEDVGVLNLELNKLEGHSFTFYDQYRERLQACVSNIGKEVTNTEQEEQKIDSWDFLDLSEQSSEAIVEGWLNDLDTDVDLEYDVNRVLGALSSLAWNCRSEENKAKLMAHGQTIVTKSLAILRHLNQNQAVTYFASACILEFTGDQFKAESWEDVKVLCDTVKEWAKTQLEVEEDAKVEKVSKILRREISQSREIVKAVVNILLKLDGVTISGKPTRKMKKNFKIFNSPKKLAFADIPNESIEQIKSLLGLK